MKEVDLNQTIYEITEAHPELIEILQGLGFTGVASEHMRETHGREMTILKGCGYLGINQDEVVKKLEEAGFKVKS